MPPPDFNFQADIDDMEQPPVYNPPEGDPDDPESEEED